jgi:HPt (histidine-containing phosphotransfer) domain-containing protein
MAGGGGDPEDVSPDDLGIDADALARAEAALAALAGGYLRWAEADMAALCAALAEAWALAPPERGGACARLFAVAHNIKGQAATFGYPLLTRLGNAVCRLVEGDAAVDDCGLARVEALVTAMGEVVTRDLRDDGGAAGRDLVLRLDGVLPPARTDEG